MNMRMANFSILALFAILLSQCSLRSMAIREVTDIVQAGVPAFERDEDLDQGGDASEHQVAGSDAGE
jgi:hypothetical protein